MGNRQKILTLRFRSKNPTSSKSNLEAQIEQQQKQIEVLIAGLNSKLKLEIPAAAIPGLISSKQSKSIYVHTDLRMTLPESIGQATIMIYTLDGKEMNTFRLMIVMKSRLKFREMNYRRAVFNALLSDGTVLDTKRMILTP